MHQKSIHPSASQPWPRTGQDKSALFNPPSSYDHKKSYYFAANGGFQHSPEKTGRLQSLEGLSIINTDRIFSLYLNFFTPNINTVSYAVRSSQPGNQDFIGIYKNIILRYQTGCKRPAYFLRK